MLFTIDAQVQHARLQNAGVESIAFLRVLFTDGDLTFYIDPGSNPNAVELRATHLSTLGVPTYFGPIVVQGGPIMQLVMLDQPEELGYLTFTIAGSTLVDSTGPVKWGDLTTIQYGNLGIVSSSYPAAPAVALELDNWNVNIGPLEEFIRGNRVR
ncbi:MAG: hypothetical protein KDI56_15995 [Xanthomonadales bacterium]|nr:hypothetical protein [Xanthomonadales bacterium]